MHGVNLLYSKSLYRLFFWVLISGIYDNIPATPNSKSTQVVDFSGGAFAFPDIRSNSAYGFFIGMGATGYLDNVRLGLRLDGAFINSYSNIKYGAPWLGASDYGIVYDFNVFDINFMVGAAYGFYLTGLQESASEVNRSTSKNMDVGIGFGDYFKSSLQFRNSYLSRWGIKVTHAYFFQNSRRDGGIGLDKVGQGIGVGFYVGWP